uniref:AAA+ ATPase domain-containing protein n=1 Tax=Cucumis sativus TaxID=3659 RepID=A0A0A0LY88_CUCSA
MPTFVISLASLKHLFLSLDTTCSVAVFSKTILISPHGLSILLQGVLIVGESGTGKTSLALAIAAEAKVPVVTVKAQELEPGLWVGQSASNVRELFQTARDLAPVIIFVEDFDLFAGVRGKFIHTKEQDHEAFINQLLVELDG